MEKVEQRVCSETHILCLTYPTQGHINPLVQFCKRLASKGLRVTLIATKLFPTNLIQTQNGSITVEHISDGFKDGETLNADIFINRYKTFVAERVAEFIKKQLSSEFPPKLLIYNSLAPWALDLARRLGIDAVPFFTQPWCVNAVYYHFCKGTFKVPLEETPLKLPSMPPLSVHDLPSFLEGYGSFPSLRDLFVDQFSNIEEAKWILCNSFDRLEDELVKWVASKYPIFTTGPTIPSMYLDKRLENDKDYGMSFFNQNTDTCMTWLDSKETGSVFYVSFGSIAALEKEQMEELAWGIKRSNYNFLWVVREKESEKLPENFSNETSEKGLVVSWCPQLEVLAHKSVGCFMTHCGWNSTLEALSLGVPMVAMPQFSDQTTNAKFIEDVWEVGVRVRVNEKGIVTREEIEMCIREVMEGEKSEELRKNSKKWKELAKEAVDEGGSSDRNIEEFVAKVVCS
ncbi:UDP-glycosyltransferase 74E2-like [Mangifera indica]|uniref:UDP-glycosyltransferase 74E2-like n=1 Tax=Mangifera indica TaxID=29780 RepID=UPI001CFA0162|nr:UDP-glycosyltransferase 74E2-like [Mangifera indica]